MSTILHRQAEELMSQADVLSGMGQHDDASRLYRKAAELEAKVFNRVSQDRPRTRGILAISAVALYRRGGEIDGAIRRAHSYLADPGLPTFAQEELLELLISLYREQQANAAGRKLSKDALLVSLRHGMVGLGIVHLDTVVLKLQQFQRFFLRVGEWLTDQPFRVKGPTAQDIVQLCTPVIGEPSPGSFQFELRLESPLQPSLFPNDMQLRLTPDQMTRTSFSILKAVNNPSSERLVEEISDEQYREAFLKLVRNLLPDGKEIREIEILALNGIESLSLTRHSKGIIRQHLSPYMSVVEYEDVLTGILRALDLDNGWVELVESGKHHKCRIGENKVLDDVVGPFVNRRVRVPGRWTGSGARRRFVLNDILPDDDGSEEDQ